MCPVSVITTTMPGNTGIICTLRRGKGTWAVFSINATNSVSLSASIGSIRSHLQGGSCIVTQAQLRASGCAALKFVVPTHGGVGVAVPQSHEPLSEQSYLSANLLSTAHRE